MRKIILKSQTAKGKEKRRKKGGRGEQNTQRRRRGKLWALGSLSHAL
jgi:hypothetical protein